MKKEVHSLLNTGRYSEAKEIVLNRLNNLSKGADNYLITLAESAGLLIDIGSESLDSEAAEKGVSIFEKENFLGNGFTQKSFYYCLGNGKEALYKINNVGAGHPALEKIKPFLIDAKNCYYKAFKEIDLNRLEHLDLQILTNLGNNLSHSGRTIEAIQIYNGVLAVNPDFLHAILGLAGTLDYCLRISFLPRTISLYTTIYNAYRKVSLYKQIPPDRKSYIDSKLKEYLLFLTENNFSLDSIERDAVQNAKDYENHNEYRKFCLDNFLGLNEHSLYCKCFSASHDDLSIGHSQLELYHEKLSKMELLLNRLKSEFGLARKLFYEGIKNAEESNEVYFNELMDGEVIGEASENIRTSFKMCFSLFDRIAHGVCYFFDLNPEKRHIYFDSFWEMPKIWEKIKDKRNRHLVSLYSISNDFNFKQNGEFRFYKEWRNKLEHNNIVLVNSIESPDLLKLFNDESFVTKIPFTLFKEEALHLLQICCASIYSYAYLIRTETMNPKAKPSGNPYIVSPKQR